jgi:invasion protein IalB
MRYRVLRSLDWRVVAAALALATPPAIALAQTPATPPAATPGELAGWNKICYADPAGAQTCTILFQVVAETGQLVAQASINSRAGQPQMIFQSWIISSPGVYVGAGMRLQIDNNTPTDIPFAICDATYCIAESQIDMNFINALKAGNQMVMSAMIRQSGTQPRQIDLPVTLRGFTAAFDGPGLNEAQAQALTDQLNQALQDRAEAARQRLIDQQQQFATPPATP